MTRFWLFCATAVLAAVSAAIFWTHPTTLNLGCLVFTIAMTVFTAIQAAR